VENNAMAIVAYAQVIRSCDKKTAIVCFRGTDPANVINLLTNAGTGKKKFHASTTRRNNDDVPAIMVHGGFLQNFSAVWYGNRGILEHLLHPYKMSKEYGDYDGSDIDEKNGQNLLKEIYITGHSLGGAMALLAGLDLKSGHQQTWDKVRGIYTFGQPMVIGEAYDVTCQNMIGDRLFRNIYYNYLVPHLPPLNTGAFDHVGAEYRFTPNHNHHHRATGWILRDDYNFRHGIQFKPRATQVFCILMTAVVFVFDCILSNRQ
jgi:Lipase (class 3)